MLPFYRCGKHRHFRTCGVEVNTHRPVVYGHTCEMMNWQAYLCFGKYFQFTLYKNSNSSVQSLSADCYCQSKMERLQYLILKCIYCRSSIWALSHNLFCLHGAFHRLIFRSMMFAETYQCLVMRRHVSSYVCFFFLLHILCTYSAYLLINIWSFVALVSKISPQNQFDT
jgi:hypothetical protein